MCPQCVQQSIIAFAVGRDHEQTLVLSHERQADLQARGPLSKALKPLDNADAVAVKVLSQGDPVHVRRRQAVQVDVIERQAPTAVLRNQRKGGAANLARGNSERLGDPAHQARLPRTELPAQADQLATLQKTGQPRPEGTCVLLAVAANCEASHGASPVEIRNSKLEVRNKFEKEKLE